MLKYRYANVIQNNACSTCGTPALYRGLQIKHAMIDVKNIYQSNLASSDPLGYDVGAYEGIYRGYTTHKPPVTVTYSV